jgi:hypothetical protein
MMQPASRSILRASPGDRLVIHGHYLGESERDGEIVQVLGPDGTPPFMVAWEDGHVSRVYPGPDAAVQHFPRSGESPPPN